jgi:hypothetical protein
MDEGRTLTIRIGDVTARAEVTDDLAPKAVEALIGALPINGTLTPAKWSGRAGFMNLTADLSGIEIEYPVCSIYPGYVVIDPSSAELLISYGTSEYRTPQGTAYVVPVARIASGLPAITHALAAMHEVGQLPISIEA